MVLNIESEIEILLFDQNKIVTYKQLGNKFNLTPFQARKELTKFIAKKSDDEEKKFFRTYLIIGEDKTTKKKRVFLANETDIGKTTENFLVLTKQIFSVQSSEIEDFDLICASDLDASHNLNRKSNIKIVSKLCEVTSKLERIEIDNTQSDDDLMSVEMPVTTTTSESKKSKSKTEDQENKPDFKVEKKNELKKEPAVAKPNSDAVLKDMDQILPKKAEEETKSIFKSDAKKQKTTTTAAKGKKTIEPSKKQPTMMSFFKKA